MIILINYLHSINLFLFNRPSSISANISFLVGIENIILVILVKIYGMKYIILYI
jgi:hypothetical protein